MYKCSYCNKEFKNNGAKAMHEKTCELNPNKKEYTAWNKGLTKENSESILKISESIKECYKKGVYNNIKRTNKPVSEETRKKLSESLKKYFAENKDKHPWKTSKKFISAPCEFLKNELRQRNIQFVEEYTPFDDYAYAIDIAWPDIKVGIEINGNQHYNDDFTLKEYYQKRHNIFEERGWKLFEIYYKHVYSLNIDTFLNNNSLDVYDKEYLDYIIQRTGQHQKQISKAKQKKIEKSIEFYKKKQELKELNKNILIDLKENSNIDFTKFGWVEKAKDYVLQKHHKSWKNLRKAILFYYPEFFDDTVYMRDKN